MEKEHSAHRLAVDCIYEALVLLMQNKPYREITITDITKRAGVSRMAFYRNYGTKDEILLKRMRDYMLSHEERMRSPADFLRRENWRMFVETLLGDPVLQNIQKAGLTEGVFRLCMEFTVRMQQKLLDWGVCAPEGTLLQYYRVGGLTGSLLYLADHADRADVDLATDQILRIISADVKPGETPLRSIS